MSKCRITQEFIDVITPAHDKLEKECGYPVYHSWDLANFYGCGTMVLYMVPLTWFVYDKHREAFKEFFDALREKGFLMSEPEETKDTFGDGDRRFCISAKIKNLEYIDDGER